MPTGRLTMRRIRDVLRLKFAQGLSERAIAASLGLGKGSVGAYLRRAREAGLSWPLPDDLDDDSLELLLFLASPTVPDPNRPVPEWSEIDKELRRRGVTRMLLWQEYRAQHPGGFGYTWFCTHFEAWKGRVRPSMRQTHVGGEKVFVDFAGDTVDIVDPDTGEVHAAKLFVAAMGASSYTYAEAVASEGLEDWIGAHTRMFSYLGGAPKAVIPDNLKSAVIKPDRHDPGLNRTYAELAEHYGTAILPARPYRPKDKAKVEVAVQVSQRWILVRLRNRRFFSLAELNAAIRPLLDDLNTRIMRDGAGHPVRRQPSAGEFRHADRHALAAEAVGEPGHCGGDHLGIRVDVVAHLVPPTIDLAAQRGLLDGHGALELAACAALRRRPGQPAIEPAPSTPRALNRSAVTNPRASMASRMALRRTSRMQSTRERRSRMSSAASSPSRPTSASARFAPSSAARVRIASNSWSGMRT